MPKFRQLASVAIGMKYAECLRIDDWGRVLERRRVDG